MSSPIRRPAVLSASSLMLALLSACGGGGGDAGGSTNVVSDGITTQSAATTVAANATLAADYSASAVDASILATQAVVAARPPLIEAIDPSHADIRAVARASGIDTTVDCLGGGTAALVLSGGTTSALGNGQFDTGEVYQVAFNGCRGALGAASISGSLTLTVDAAGSGQLSLTLVASNLAVTLPQGSVSLNGSISRQGTITTAGGITTLSGRLTSSGLTLATTFRSRQSTFTLGALDITRTSTWSNGVFQSSTLNGTHTLTAALPDASYSFTVATQGGVTYASNGVPQSGSWTITLPNTRVGVSIASGSATLTVDEGKDGSIEHTYTVPANTLPSSAG